jgi:hypothetical protein
MMVGLIVSVLIGLNSVKIITEKRLEFFREAQAGVNVTAFYIAASITTIVEQSAQAIFGSALVYLILRPSTSYAIYAWNFFMISWLSTSWSQLFAVIVPLDSVSIFVVSTLH